MRNLPWVLISISAAVIAAVNVAMYFGFGLDLAPYVVGVLVAGGVTALTLAADSRSADDSRNLRKHFANKGWLILLLDGPKLEGRWGPVSYNLRFRDANGTLFETIYQRDGTRPLECIALQEVPPELDRAMADVSLEMDCRRCGTTIPKFRELCPYCHARRDVWNERMSTGSVHTDPVEKKSSNQLSKPTPSSAAHRWTSSR